MGFLENLFGTNSQYTVRDNKTGEERQVQDARDLEKFAEREQDKDRPEKPDDFFSRIFSR